MYDIISVAVRAWRSSHCACLLRTRVRPDPRARRAGRGRQRRSSDPLGADRRGGGRVTPAARGIRRRQLDRDGPGDRAAGLPLLRPRLSREAVDARSRVDPIRRADGAAHRQHADHRRLHGEGVRQRPRAGRPRLRPDRTADLPGLRDRPRRASSAGRPTRSRCSSFNAVAVLAVYFVQRVQSHLPLNPTHVGGVQPFMALNTSVSFVTNTDWQSYIPETTVSHLTQMTVLGVQNFLSAAIGLTVAVALIRGLARRRSSTIGSFWVDLVRSCVRILLPLSLVLAVVFLSQGVIDNFHGNTPYKPVDSALVQAKDANGQPDGLGRRARRPGRVAGGDQGARHQRRRLLQRQLRATRSRTRTGSRTSCRCTSPRSSASGSRSRTGRWSATSARAGRSSR